MTSEIVDGGYRVNASDGWTPASVTRSRRNSGDAGTRQQQVEVIRTINSLGANGILTTACLQSQCHCELCDRDTINTLV